MKRLVAVALCLWPSFTWLSGQEMPDFLHGVPYDPALDAGLRRGYTEVFNASR